MTDKQQVSIGQEKIDEMNVVMAAFEGRLFYGKHTIDKYGGDTGNGLPEMKYHSSWDALIPAWTKAYKLYLKLPTYRANNFIYRFKGPMKNAMITGNITEAHRVLYDAIQWLNKQNENGK